MSDVTRLFEKDPDEVLDYSIKLTDWLVGGDTISSAVWTVESGITKDSDSISDDVATIWLSGGTLDRSYSIAGLITTSDGRVMKRTITIAMVSK